jgi:2-polyprenyl-6-hydroxyphenyl methylase/3-demethylubiquinone-9 3-methyltransferase
MALKKQKSIRKGEIEKFSKDSDRWWDEHGPFAPLHRLNPARMGHIREQIGHHYGLSSTSLKPFEGLSILDIGCGGGLVCEPLARLGADVTGIDADITAIETARAHATQSHLKITYENKTAESIQRKFDVVLALEVIEHVEDPADFVKTCSALTRAGGLIIFSTLNRTAKSYALGIIAAEYILNWVPRGTHEWRSFIKPSELSRFTRAAGLQPENISGLVFDPLAGTFRISADDVAVNYFLTARK